MELIEQNLDGSHSPSVPSIGQTALSEQSPVVSKPQGDDGMVEGSVEVAQPGAGGPDLSCVKAEYDRAGEVITKMVVRGYQPDGQLSKRMILTTGGGLNMLLDEAERRDKAGLASPDIVIGRLLLTADMIESLRPFLIGLTSADTSSVVSGFVDQLVKDTETPLAQNPTLTTQHARRKR